MEATPRQFQARPERVESIFATDLVAYEQSDMLWLDFVQDNQSADQHWLVARIVMRPELLDGLINALSRLRDESP